VSGGPFDPGKALIRFEYEFASISAELLTAISGAKNVDATAYVLIQNINEMIRD
jgi:hypothetical protein